MVIDGVRKSVEDVSTYVYGKTVEDIKKDYELNNVAKLCFNENPYAPYPCCVEAIIDEIQNLNCYPDAGYIKLKELISKKNNLSRDNVALAHGIVGLLETLSKMFIETGDEVIIPHSTFGLYEDLSKIMGAEIKYTNLDNGTIDVGEILGSITKNTKLVWISNPNNPTGTIIKRDDFNYLIDNIPEDVWIIFDEAYYEFAEGDEYPDSIEAVREGEKIILTRTFSKAYGMAGLRLGYALASQDVIETINSVSQPFNANRAGLVGAMAALQNENYCKKIINKINKSKQYLSCELKKMGCEVFPSYTNFVFFKTPYSAEDIAEKLLKKGVMVAPGTRWNFKKGMRVSVGKQEENQKFLDELSNILNK